MNKKILALALCLSLQACSKVDDYMLGVDNAPAPKALAPIKSNAKITEKWSVSAGKGQKTNANLKLKPEIIGNIIYTADASGLIQAINKSSGQVIWTKNIDSGIVSGPTLGSGYIALGTDSSTLLLLKQSDGSQLWEAKASGEVLSKPIINGNKLIAKTIDGNLYAFDLSDGHKLWMAEHAAPSLILKASSSPVIVGNKLVLVGHSDGKMDALDLQTGHLIWQRSIAFASGSSDVERLVDIDADPIVRGNVAYLASYQGYIGALSLTDGQFIWRKPASVYKNMTVDGQTIYLTDSEDVVWAINRQNGHVNWKQVALKARGLTEPVLMGDRLVLADKTGLLHVLLKNNGELVSRSQVGGAVAIAPTVAGKNVYLMSANGKLSRFSVS
ncbi:MAG: outer membrane protein assembly factor BamB [Tatlockia sp.]|nr:outer membrane protein assembly factor BamB [Tatlockia sp.]